VNFGKSLLRGFLHHKTKLLIKFHTHNVSIGCFDLRISQDQDKLFYILYYKDNPRWKIIWFIPIKYLNTPTLFITRKKSKSIKIIILSLIILYIQ